MKKTVFLLPALLLLAACVQPAPVQDNTNVSEETSLMRAGKNLVLVFDQKPGKAVTANQIVLETEGYVVVHEEKNGTFGDILGFSQMLPSGISEQVTVNLSRETRDSETVYAMLHADNGDREFRAETDLPLKDDQGNILHAIVPISSTAEDPGEVTL